MSFDRDLKVGQLAVARNLVTLDDLLTCFAQSSREQLPLSDTLLANNLLTNDALNTLYYVVDHEQSEVIAQEIATCETLIFDQLAQTLDRQTAYFVKKANKTFPVDDNQIEQISQSPDRLPHALNSSLSYNERYKTIEELGRGGMGRVLRVHDTTINRDIALKTLLPNASDEVLERLLLEAHITGSLEHPNIIPLYDLGCMPDGTPYYTMRVIREQSLLHILQEEKNSAQTYSLLQYIAILRQVCLAIQYAHDSGVIHRDLKPENILVGRYGEVYVIDWGIAKVLSASLHANAPIPLARQTQAGSILGTPHYMAPEQALGEQESIDHRTDVYALGAILYEILTLAPVFDAAQVLPLLIKVVNEEPVPPTQRTPHRSIPQALEDICLKALTKDPAQRFQSAQELADELNLFLEGVKERERRREEAYSLIAQANDTRESYRVKQNRLNYLMRVLSAEQQRIPAWAQPSEKEVLWQLEQQVEELQIDIDRCFGEAVRLYGQALSHDRLPQARQALADMHWQRFREAEIAGDRAQSAYFESLVKQYNDGQYDALLAGMAQLDIHVEPDDAKIKLLRYELMHRRMIPVEKNAWTSSPIINESIPHGSYLLEIEHDDYIAQKVPLLLERDEHKTISVSLYTKHTIPEDFVIVPGGTFLSGNIQAQNLKHHIKSLPTYAIMRLPVTCGQYLAFLNNIASTDLERAKRHAPRMRDDAPSYFPLDDNNQFYLPEKDAEGDTWHADWPMCMINFHDAEAYAKWRSARDGYNYYIPTADEWEKAARGVDGRLYPWGNHFDASFCKMRESIRGKAMPVPVGSYHIDSSPYGAMDMAGNIHEWTSSWSSEQDQTKILCGACFASIDMMCRLDWHVSSPTSYRLHLYGFRLAMAMGDI